MKLVTSDEMRAIEAEAFASGTSAATLMERAGAAVANAIRDRLGVVRGLRVLILVGPGNNGGDGLVAARHFYDFGAEVTVALLAARDESDANLSLVQERDIDVIAANEGGVDDLFEAIERADAILDAVLGIGRARPLEAMIASVLDRLATSRAAIFAVDIPTGVDADTGSVDPHAARMDATLSLGFSKLGLHLLPASEYVGEVQVLDIGLPDDPAALPQTDLLTEAWVRPRLPVRPAESNKGTFGRVLVIAGSDSYTGAAALASLGAYRAGAGLVTLATVPKVSSIVAVMAPEVTHMTLAGVDGNLDASAAGPILRALPNFKAVLIGPGLGLSAETQALVRGLLTHDEAANVPFVIDADALNALSKFPAWWENVKAQAVLTPHPGELSRLTGSSVSDIQGHRIDTSREMASTWRQTLVLKGANTIVTAPGGRTLISPFANAALATAGTGDVLAGVIAGLIAQGVEPVEAAACGVYLHAEAAEAYRDTYGESGLIASDLLSALPRVAHRLRVG